MATHIRLLSSEVVGQIAAGEVVERPSAAIKELVENSMDAGATSIAVEIRDGGLTSFRVVDNGSGIQPSDIRLAFARHATSKISQAGDLMGVQTLGFRGEALASIAAVAKVTCTTRVRGADCGLSVQNNGGEISELREAPCPEGTSFLVKDLFFNAPVRRKFLKKPSTETGYVSDLMLRFILSHPQISFRYIADGKTVYFSPGDGKLESAAMSIYGLSALEKLKHVSGNMNGIVLDGFVGVGDLSRGNRAHESFILNGRLIKSNLLTAALEEACKQRVMIGRFPMCILHLTMPFEAVDVNVHPNKWEVRFQNEPGVREAVCTLVNEALQESSPLNAAAKLFDEPIDRAPVVVKRIDPQKVDDISSIKKDDSIKNKPDYISSNTDIQKKEKIISDTSAISSGFSTASAPLTAHSSNSILPPAAYKPEAITPRRNDWDRSAPAPIQKQDTPFIVPVPVPAPEKTLAESPKEEPPSPPPVIQQEQQALPISPQPDPVGPAAEQLEAAPVDEKFTRLPLRLIGIVFDTYIILEYQDRMLLCDQHAVHERLLYERMMKACAGDTAAQGLLTPVLVRLTHREYEAFLENGEALRAAGFDAADFGDLTVQLRAVPMVLGVARTAECLCDALDDLSESGQISTQKRTDRIIQMACKHAVKGGEKIPVDAMMELVRRMLEDNVMPTCPHGRPLMIEVTQRELEKRFHRIQN